MVRLTDRPDMTIDVYHGRKKQHNNNNNLAISDARQRKQPGIRNAAVTHSRPIRSRSLLRIRNLFLNLRKIIMK